MSVEFSEAFFDNYVIASSGYYYDDSDDDEGFESNLYDQNYDNKTSERNYYKDLYRKSIKDYESLDPIVAYHRFTDAVILRLMTGYFKDNLIDRIDFKYYPGIQYDGILKNFTIVKEIKPLENNPYYKWWLENHTAEHLSYTDKMNDWIKGPGINFIEKFIVRKVVPFAKKYYSIDREREEDYSLEDENMATQKNNGGRPLGSKNKKEEKITFLPTHKIPTNADNNLEISALINAIADIVWRFDGIFYSKAISCLDITDNQKRYVAAMLIKSAKIIKNDYWYVKKTKEVYQLFSKIKRKGYYLPTGNLMSSYDISELTGIESRTLRYRLQNMTVAEATKDWKKTMKNTL